MNDMNARAAQSYVEHKQQEQRREELDALVLVLRERVVELQERVTWLTEQAEGQRRRGAGVYSVGAYWLNIAHLDYIDTSVMEQHPHPITLYFAGRAEPLTLQAPDSHAFVRALSNWLGVDDEDDEDETDA